MIAEEYFDSQLGIDIWNNKYRQNNESFDEWLDRVSGGNESVRMLIEQKKFMFGGRILANRGIDDRNVSLSNCYYFDIPEDSIDGIYETARKLAKTFSYGGGVGVDMSVLAPKGAKINNAAKYTTGAVSFMSTFNEVAQTIGAEGRRAALLMSLKSEHPDLEEFITCKSEDGKISGANISIQASDDFMYSVENGEKYTQSFTRHNGDKTIKLIDSRNVFRKFAENNWDWSEPGMQFIDTMRNWNMLSECDEYVINGTNACNELVLPDGGACILGSINLAEIEVIDGQVSSFDLGHVVKNAIEGLNEVLVESLDRHPLEYQKEVVNKWRQIGLGVMGYADLLIRLGLKYGSKEAIEFTNELFKFILKEAVIASSQYAYHNESFPMFEDSGLFDSIFVKMNFDKQMEEQVMSCGLANGSLLSIAPTGSISTMLGVSGGIEPHYALSYKRKTESLHGEDKYYDVNIPIVEWYRESYNKYELPDYFVTALDIPISDRLQTQATIQRYVDTSISSTINLPNSATVEDVEDIYINAWKLGLKGVTVHRQGNKREGILTVNDISEDKDVNTELKRGDWEPKPNDLTTTDRDIYTGCGRIKMFIRYSRTNNKIFDFWIKRSGKGGCERSLDNIAVAMSGMLRLGGNISNIDKAFEGIGVCNSFSNARKSGQIVSKGNNCGDAMLRKLLEFKEDADNGNLDINGRSLKDIDGTPLSMIQKQSQPIKKGSLCPDCNALLVYTGGCVECANCGYSKCT